MGSEELYYDHYKDTFELQRSYLSKRDKLTLFLILFTFLVSLSFGNVDAAKQLSDIVQIKQLGDISISYNVINTLVIFSFLWLSMAYYQVNLNIEKMYKYLHCIESELSSGKYKIEREGKNYMECYPWLSSWAHYIYVLLFPVLIILVSLVKFCEELDSHNSLMWINLILLLLVFILSILYLSNRWMDESAFSKSKYPNKTLPKRFKLYFGIKE